MTEQRLIDIGSPKRIWTLPSIHSDVWQLVSMHDKLMPAIRPGDRIVYLGNYIGVGKTPLETIDEILTFRRMVLSMPGMLPSDFIYLRGLQEEMWQKLLQIHFAPNPLQVLTYLLQNGMEPMIEALGSSSEEAIRAAREGVLGLTRWTNILREKMRCRDGYECFFSSLKRAAFTCQTMDTPILFVNAGIDPSKQLTEQTDNFWWSGKNFNKMSDAYAPFQKVIRGYDPNHEGLHLNCVTASLDAGCGFGGPLISACVDPNKGEIQDIISLQ